MNPILHELLKLVYYNRWLPILSQYQLTGHVINAEISYDPCCFPRQCVHCEASIVILGNYVEDLGYKGYHTTLDQTFSKVWHLGLI